MKKILITFEDYYEIANYLADSLKNKGIEVEIFLSNKNEHWVNKFLFRKIDKLARSLRLAPKGMHLFSYHKYSYKKYLDSRFEEEVNRVKPDLIFCIHGQRFGEEFLIDTQIPKIGWWIEPDPDKRSLVHFAKSFDLYLSYDSEVVDYLNNIGINSKYQSHVTSPMVFYTMANVKSEFDILFYGAWSPWREQVLFSALKETKNIALYGDKWFKKCSLINKNELKKIYKGEHISGSDLNEAINKSRIVLNAQRLKGLTTGLDTRAFDVLASGALLITDAPKDLSRHFMDGEHLIIYHNLKDLSIKIRDVLDENIDTSQIKERGKQKVLDELTYDHLSKRMVEILNRDIN